MDKKTCSKCKELKVITEFHKNKTKLDGYQTYCKSCKKNHNKNYREENKEHMKNMTKKWLKNHPEKFREYNHRNCPNEYQIKYRENNPRNHYDKRYDNSQKGKERRFKGHLKRRSHKEYIILSPIKRKRLLDRDNWTCQKCGIKVHDKSTGNWNTPDKAHIDHIIPISKGGNNEAGNLQVLCRTCNLSKNDKLVLN